MELGRTADSPVICKQEHHNVAYEGQEEDCLVGKERRDDLHESASSLTLGESQKIYLRLAGRGPPSSLPLPSECSRNGNSDREQLDEPLSSRFSTVIESVGNDVSIFQQDCMSGLTRCSSSSKVDPIIEFSLHENIEGSREEKYAERLSRVGQLFMSLGENTIGSVSKNETSVNNDSKSSDATDISSAINHSQNFHDHDSNAVTGMASSREILVSDGLNLPGANDSTNETGNEATQFSPAVNCRFTQGSGTDKFGNCRSLQGSGTDRFVNENCKSTQGSETDKFGNENCGSTQGSGTDKFVNGNSKRRRQRRQVVPPDPELKSPERGNPTRSSLLPRACKTQSQKRFKPEYHRLFIKEFNCGACKETFTKKVFLKKHNVQAHGSKLKLTEESKLKLTEDKKSTKNGIFLCPVCKGTYSRKYGLKRHFWDKHSNVKSIPCPQCKKVARNLEDYLNHIEIHTVLKSKSPDFTDLNSESCQLNCSECQQIFQNDDALKLHELNHSVMAVLAKAESNFPSLTTTCRKSCTCKDPSNSVMNHASLGLMFSDHFPRDLMTSVEQSLDTVSKMTSRLDLLGHLLSAELSSATHLKLLQAMNVIKSLCDGLSSLSSSLSQILSSENGTRLTENRAGEVEENIGCKNDVADGNDGECDEEDLDETQYVKDKDQTPVDQSLSEEKIIITLPVPVVKTKRPMKRGRRKLKVPRKACKGREPHDHICLQCGKEFKDCVNLRRHSAIHQEHRPYKCKICKLTFRRTHHLKMHMTTHTDDRPFRCDKCDFAAKTSKTLQTHSRLHAEDRKLPCEKCDFVGRTLNQLSRHEKKHNPCPLCSYIPADDADYKLHKRSHLNYTCTECNYSCNSSWQLRRHSRKHNPPSKDQQKYCCELCGYSCFEKRQFDYHMTRHKNKTPFSCSTCDYKCSSRTSFDAHKLMHAGLKPYLCSICGASFRRSSYLNNHMLIHKDEKKHVCRTCGHPFRSRYNLKVHEMIHTGEKQFKCHLCHFACRRNKELRLHLEKHALLDQPEDVKPPLIDVVKQEGD